MLVAWTAQASLREWRRLGDSGGSSTFTSRICTEQLIFVALFAISATRSALGRSDGGHFLQWSIFPVLATFLIAFRLVAKRFDWPALKTAPLLSLCLAMPLALSHGLGLISHLRAVSEDWRILVEELSPNPALGACHDTTFTAAEDLIPRDAAFVRDTCVFEELLRRKGITLLMIDHSAPWYYVRFGIRPFSRFYAPERAYIPDRQLELVDDIRKYRPQALLKADSYGALAEFDVPNALRIPIVDAYLVERLKGFPTIHTPLGLLYLLNEPTPRAQGLQQLATFTGYTNLSPPISIATSVYTPTAGLLFIEGTAREGIGLQGWRVVELNSAKGTLDANLVYGSSPDNLSRYAPMPRLLAGGWELRTRVSQIQWQALKKGRTVDVEAVLATGQHVRVPLDLAETTELAKLSGKEWRHTASKVELAGEWGRFDRQVVLDKLAAEISIQSPSP